MSPPDAPPARSAPSPLASTGARLLALGCAATLALGQAGCADTYLIPSGAAERLATLPAGLAARSALPAIRDRGAARTWVRAADVTIDPTPALGGYRRAAEVENRRRVSPLGLTGILVGALALGTGSVLVGMQSACAGGGPLPCLAGTGDAAVTLSLGGAILLFAGVGLQAARAAEHHPAEVQPSDSGLFFFGGGEGNAGKTPLE